VELARLAQASPGAQDLRTENVVFLCTHNSVRSESVCS
jgi:hypothetical protein